MVAINHIIHLNEDVTQFQLDAGDRAVWNGIQAEWRGASFVAKGTNPEYPDIRTNQPIPKKYRGAFVNAAREAKGLPRLNFDGAGNLRPGTPPPSGADTRNTTTTTTPASAKPPLEMDDLSKGQQRQLSRHGRIQFGGHTYTSAEIQAFTQAAAARRAQAGRDAKATLFDLGDDPKKAVRQNKTFLQGLTAKTARTILPGYTLSIGVQAGGWLALRGHLLDLNEATLVAMKKEGISDAQIKSLADDYETASQRLLGMWFAITAGPDIARAVFAGVPAVLRPIKTVIRAWNWTTMAVQQGASVVTGAGFFAMLAKNALQLVIVEAGMAGLTYLIMSSATVREWMIAAIQHDIGKYVSQMGFKTMSHFNSALESAWNWSAEEIFDNPEAQATEVDLMKRIKLSDPDLAQSLFQGAEDEIKLLPQTVQDDMRGLFDNPADTSDNRIDKAPSTERNSSNSTTTDISDL